MTELADEQPDRAVSARSLFGLEWDMDVPAFGERGAHVPAMDHGYRFNPEVTRAVLAGFAHNRRVLLQGLHGTGKSSHVEQIAARLNWPCIRVNLDGHVSRLDLVGRDMIVVRDGMQVTEFQEGILPWALQRPVALILDEYDVGRPEVMFVIQQLLERDGRFTLLDQRRVIEPHPWFRLFATANTIGLGDMSGMYQGTRALNHAQLDRWNVIAALNYLPPAEEVAIVEAQVTAQDSMPGGETIQRMVALANLTREGFAAGDISTLMSPRTVISWAENVPLFHSVEEAFRLTFLNRCDEAEQPLVAEYYQRCFEVELSEALRMPAAAGA